MPWARPHGSGWVPFQSPRGRGSGCVAAMGADREASGGASRGASAAVRTGVSGLNLGSGTVSGWESFPYPRSLVRPAATSGRQLLGSPERDWGMIANWLVKERLYAGCHNGPNTTTTFGGGCATTA